MEKIEVVLLSQHEHEGKKYEIGQTLTVDKATANWLLTRQVAQLHIETKGEQK